MAAPAAAAPAAAAAAATRRDATLSDWITPACPLVRLVFRPAEAV
jgi:hypothetical protein